MKHTNLISLPFADPAHELPVRSRFEACSGFSADATGSPVCGECGWLAAEHRSDPIVRRLAS